MADDANTDEATLPASGEGITILELRLFSCRFIIRYDEGSAIYCGDTGRPYCPTHHRMCYQIKQKIDPRQGNPA
jgi:hypothetical protein